MTTLDKQALEKAASAIDARLMKRGLNATELATEGITAYLAALPEVRRWVAFYPAGRGTADLNNAYFYTSKEDFYRNVSPSEEPGMLKTIEVREVRS